MIQLACMGAARQCPPTGPQEKYQLVARPLSTLSCFTFDGRGWVIFRLKKIIALEQKHLNLDLLSCFYFKKLCILTNVMLQKRVNVWLKPNINRCYFWKNMHIFVANLFMCNVCNHLIIAACQSPYPKCQRIFMHGFQFWSSLYCYYSIARYKKTPCNLLSQ